MEKGEKQGGGERRGDEKRDRDRTCMGGEGGGGGRKLCVRLFCTILGMNILAGCTTMNF